MHKEFARFNYSFLLMILLCFLPIAAPMPALNISALTKDSSHIVVGEITSLRDAGSGTLTLEGGQSIPVQKKHAELRVSRAVKGQVPSTQIIFEVVQTRAYYGFADITAGKFGMFFLKPGSSNAFALTSNYYPYLVASRSNFGATGDDYERVVAEIVNVVASAETTPDDKVKAISMLDRINILNIVPSLRQAVNSDNMKVKLSAVAALLRRNDISSLTIAETALLKSSAIEDQSLITNLISSLMEVKDPKAVPILSRLQKSPSVEIRRSAVYALRQTDVGAAIKPLTQALYDSDQKVRYHAVTGLSRITKQTPGGPSIEKYNANEQQYLTYWRDWAKNH